MKFLSSLKSFLTITADLYPYRCLPVFSAMMVSKHIATVNHICGSNLDYNFQEKQPQKKYWRGTKIYINYIRLPCWIKTKISLKVRNLWLWSLWFGFVDLIWVWGRKRLLWIWCRLRNRFIFRQIRLIDQYLFTYKYVKDTLVWPLSTKCMSHASPEVPLSVLNEGERARS